MRLLHKLADKTKQEQTQLNLEQQQGDALGRHGQQTKPSLAMIKMATSCEKIP